MRTRRGAMLRAALLAILVVLSTAYVNVPASAQKPVTIRLSWKVKGEFAPLFVAVQKGFYKEHGVNVQVLEGSGSGPTVTALANGRDEFAYVAAFELAQGVSQDMPIVMVANYIRKDPSVLVSFQPLRKINDLEGKTVGSSTGDRFPRIWPALARAYNVDQNKVRIANLDPAAAVTQLLQGRLDVMSAFYTNEVPVIETRAQRRANVLWLSDYGFNFLGHGLTTGVKFAAQHPDEVKAVIAGTTEGFEYTIRHPVEAADIMIRLFPEALQKEIVALQIGNTLELTKVKGLTGGLGWSSPELWHRTLDNMQRTGFIARPKPLDRYFTNRFVGP